MGPPIIRRLVAFAGTSSLLGLASCDSPLVPPCFAGTYVLTSINGETLPHAHGSSDLGAIMLVADTLSLLPDGSGLRIRHFLTVGPGDFVIEGPSRMETPMRLSDDPERGVRLVDTFDCPLDSGCIHDFSYEIRRTRPILELRSDEASLRYKVVATVP
jgi:hypothetical protein